MRVTTLPIHNYAEQVVIEELLPYKELLTTAVGLVAAVTSCFVFSPAANLVTYEF